MPFVKNTPESLLPRTDSLDPNRTCHGVTSAGQPCRRALASAASPSDPQSSFCWQHKDQSAAFTPVKSPHAAAPAGRSSIDTLAERLGIASLEEKKKKKKKKRRRESGRPGEGGAEKGATLRCCFCFTVPIEDVSAGPRPQPRPVQLPEKKSASTPAHHHASTPPKTPHAHSSPAKIASSPTHLTPSPKPRKPRSYLELIPASTDPQTASLLLAELSRPYADSEEPGYIYMFWMAPPSRQQPAADAARALLSSGRRSSGRPSDAGAPSTDDAGKDAKGTMLLKIGRASNVQRRMNEWSRQCGYEVEVLRFYPYVPHASSTSPSSSPGGGAGVPKMTPHVKRVERLIHLELAGMGLRAERGKCEACGREHREWFEVEGSRRGVGKVDEVIRRWVEWDEGVSKG